MAGFSKEQQRLSPLLREAEERHRTFKTEWKNGVAVLGWKRYKESERHIALLSAFREAQQQLEEATGPILESLQVGAAESVAGALAYLSLRYRPFRSGYVCQKLARALKKFPLDIEQKGILRRILLDRVTWPWSQSRELWSLIPGVRSPEFEASLRELPSHDRDFVQRRARMLLARYFR